MLITILIYTIICIICIYFTTAILIFVYGKKKVNIKKDYSYRPTVTVFIPTYNEEKYIARKLDEILSQTYPVDEILVLDCSKDRTPEIVAEYSRKHQNIRLVRQHARIGNARTLNEAIELAKGKIFVKTDVDTCLLSNNALREIVACFADPKIGAVTGTRINNRLDIEDKYTSFLTMIQVAESNIDSILIGNSTSLLAFRREIMEKVDPESMAEDTEEVIRIRRKGYRAVIDPSVVSEEEIPTDLRKRRLQKDRRAEGIIRVLFKNKDMLFNPRYGKYGMIVLPLEFFILVISPFLSLIFISSLLYIMALYYPLLSIFTLASIVVPFVTKRTLLSAIIDVNISGLIATIRALKKPAPLWKKVR
jgi:cellulose synthase/poly-beta-1,6-N-acetylglucosamine synthase-like glycosyltransferase